MLSSKSFSNTSSSVDSETQLHQKIQAHINAIEEKGRLPGLLNTLQAVVSNIKDNDTEGSKKASQKRISASPSSQPTGLSWIAGAIIQDLEQALHLKPKDTKAFKEVLSLPLNQQLVLLSGLVERILGKNAPINDRNNTFEAVMAILSDLGPDKKELVLAVTQPLIELYHNDIPKPYINIVGNNFRTADGSKNCISFPDVGKAGSYYSRSVTSQSLNNEQLPPPALVFERLLKRPEGTFTPHKGGINMLLFYLAILITHDLFYSDPKDPKRNLTTSYLDLSTLYGFDQEGQHSVRQMKGGLLKPDQWFDKRLVIQPPGVGALLVLFSRNHNYIAEKLLEINENGRFSYGPGKELATEEDQDEELFQTARLINNGCYINMVVYDYIRTILGTQSDSDFVLDPFVTPSYPIYGNTVSIEFNVIYRWHAAIGQKDTEWLTDVFKALGPSLHKSSKSGNGRGDVFDDLIKPFNENFVHASDEELTLGLPLAGAHRDIKTGGFSDFDVTRLLRTGFTQSASEVGNGLNTPSAMAPIEIAGIQQARTLHTCYFNDFRRFLKLMPLLTFEDFSEKPEVQAALKELYGEPDKVELYAGLMVERGKVIGLRLPYTMGRAILSDAINLLRNDRILTQEMTPSNLTNWGYQYQKGEPSQHSRVIPRMLNTLLPNANANHQPAFSQEEIDKLFLVPTPPK